MFFDLLPAALKGFVDTIFGPPKTILQNGVNYLDEISMIAGKGISLNNYLGFVYYLPPSLQTVVNSLISSIILLSILLLIRTIASLYFNIKEGAKWW